MISKNSYCQSLDNSLGGIEMKKWENPKLQDVCLERTEARGKACESCRQALLAEVSVDGEDRVGQIICYFCECCGTEFHTKDYGGSSASAEDAAEKHESTCAQCS